MSLYIIVKWGYLRFPTALKAELQNKGWKMFCPSIVGTTIYLRRSYPAIRGTREKYVIPSTNSDCKWAGRHEIPDGDYNVTMLDDNTATFDFGEEA